MDKRDKKMTTLKLHDLGRTAEKRNDFFKGCKTNWSYELHSMTEVHDDTLPNHRIKFLPGRNSEAF